MIYAKVENGQLIKQGLRLPFSDGQTSFGKSATPESLASFGYLPIIDTPPTLASDEKIGSITYDVQASQVVKVYQVDKIPLDKFKADKLAEFKAKREAETNAPLDNFDVDSVADRENINGAIDYFDTLSQGTGVVKWTMADNSEADVTLAELQAVKDNYVLRKGQVFAKYQQLKEAVDVATTIEELEVIQW